jgi:hypothetical protein
MTAESLAITVWVRVVINLDKTVIFESVHSLPKMVVLCPTNVPTKRLSDVIGLAPVFFA